VKFAAIIGSIVIGGAAIGIGLERAELFSPIGEPQAAAGFNEVSYSLCPGVSELGTFHGGDRVFITGINDDGAWLEVRAPFDTDARVWVETDQIIEDSSLEDLPLVDCDLAVATGPEVSDTTTTTTAEPSTTTVGSTTTIAAPPTTDTTEAPPTTETTEPPPPPPPSDDEGPRIDFFQADEDEIWEDGPSCAGQQMTVQVGGVVVDDGSDVDAVWIDWEVGLSFGTAPALELAAHVYFAEIGPFPDSTITGADASISLSLFAYDIHQNESSVTSDSLVVLRDCVIK